ncbi:hypothetical protein VF21_10529 [Pseudogymnoascus sp. 05NY08]|nr:hypothetical protein VF21_10529 [Pseudogymnoascus sp. 05NY08]
MGVSIEDEKSATRASAVEDKSIDTPPTLTTESIDSRDLDKAFVYLAGQNQSHLDHNVDLKALRRKIDWRILPVMSACYGLQFLDKVLINYSGVMGIREELHLVKNDFSNASSVFYISYLIAMVPNGVIGFIILPKSPMTAKFLTDSEKVALLNHIAVNQTGIENRHFKWSQLKEIVLDIQIWLLVAMTVSVSCSSGVISSYSSIVIASLGYSAPKAALLTAPSGFVTICSSLITGFGVRYSSNRWAWIAAFCIPGMIGGALMSFTPHSNPAAIIIGTHLVYAIIPTLMLTFQWAMSNCVGQTKRVLASAFVSGAFAIGSIIGPQTFQDRDKPEYKPAKIAILATQGGGAFFATLLFGYYYWANKKKDRVEAALGPRSATGEGRQEWGSKTDKENLSFRYVY